MTEEYNHPSEISECCGRFLVSQDYDALTDGEYRLCPTCITQWRYIAGPPSSWKECGAIRTDSLIEYTKQAVCDPASEAPIARDVWEAMGFSGPPDAAQVEKLKRMSDSWWEALYIGRVSVQFGERRKNESDE